MERLIDSFLVISDMGSLCKGFADHWMGVPIVREIARAVGDAHAVIFVFEIAAAYAIWKILCGTLFRIVLACAPRLVNENSTMTRLVAGAHVMSEARKDYVAALSDLRLATGMRPLGWLSYLWQARVARYSIYVPAWCDAVSFALIGRHPWRASN